MSDMRSQLIQAFAENFPSTSKFGQHLRIAASGLSKQADVGKFVHTILEPPASLLSAVGQGLSGAGRSAATLTASMPEHGGLTRGLASIPSALQGGAEAFHQAGGLRAAALTGMGALGLYGAKKLYDESPLAGDSSPPPGYYAPGGY